MPDQRDLARKLARGAHPQTRWCEICGSGRHIVRHHPDYARPVDVQFLCAACHRKVHPGLRRSERAAGATTVTVPGLARCRLAAMLSQRELGLKAEVNPASVHRGERGLPLQLKVVRRLADALNVEPGQLLRD